MWAALAAKAARTKSAQLLRRAASTVASQAPSKWGRWAEICPGWHLRLDNFYIMIFA